MPQLILHFFGGKLNQLPAIATPTVLLDATTLPATVTAAIAEVSDAPLAHELGMLAQEFQYKRMLKLIHGVDQNEQT